jgi:hypothetical protein
VSDDPAVPDGLRDHESSPLARQRAARAGLDLEALRREAPERYRMLNAEEIARVSPELAEATAELVIGAFPERNVYRVPGESGERLLAFPPLDEAAFVRFDDDAAELVARPSFADAYVFFRTVRDLRGGRRELMVPTPPEAWRGEVCLVGPFESREAAESWPAGRLPPELIADPVPYRGRWFCDVFRSDEDLLFPASDRS